MVERPYKCTLCHASFRNESGMMWHVSRRHEAPQALEALGKNYEEKLDVLRKENSTKAQEINNLKAKLDDAKINLTNTNLLLVKQQEENIELMSRIRNMADDQHKLVIAFVVRDEILKKRFGIMLPNPFGESENNPQSPIQQ